mmetsp:Transcript_42003/g.68011  ORF Transcript_42003/g.68011 Transcript_42003/m.68011 type:complete len:497 (-) Transcript_42003:106-1596(-)
MSGMYSSPGPRALSPGHWEAAALTPIRRPGGLAALAAAATGGPTTPKSGSFLNLGLEPPQPQTPLAARCGGNAAQSPDADRDWRNPLPRAYSTFDTRYGHQLVRQGSEVVDPAAGYGRWGGQGVRAHSPEAAPFARRDQSPQRPQDQQHTIQRAYSAVTTTSSFHRRPATASDSFHRTVAQRSPAASDSFHRTGPGTSDSFHRPRVQPVVITGSSSTAPRSGSVQQQRFVGGDRPRGGYGSPRQQDYRSNAGSQSFSPPVVGGMSGLLGCTGPAGRLVGRLGESSRPLPEGTGSARAAAYGMSQQVRQSRPRDQGLYAMPLSEEQEMPEFSEPSADLGSLLQYFDDLNAAGVRIIEATYVVNSWTLYGLIPLKHHGFILRSEDDMYLTLDFSTRGILWDTFDEYPDVPDGTLFAKKYRVDISPSILRAYCKETKPFSWPDNDCSKWAKGILLLMHIMEDPYVDNGAMGKLSSSDVMIGCAGRGMGPMGVIGCLGGS